jgi:eukaryotic-like serine/threonine-protein kinase
MQPTRLGKYLIIQPLDEGASAEIYLARDESNRTVVIRRLHRKFNLRLLKRREFLRGLRLQTNFDHPNVLKLHELHSRSLLPFAVLEYIDGLDLRQAMAQRWNQNSEVLIFEQILRGVHHIHERGYMHLDLKPENILISREGDVKIVDFDFAEKLGEKPRYLSKIKGTVLYLAPEQILKEAVDERTDIFSIGVLGYELFTGHKPITGTNRTQALKLTKQLDLPFPAPKSLNPNLSPAMDRILARCVEKRVERRYPSIQNILSDLNTARSQQLI